MHRKLGHDRTLLPLLRQRRLSVLIATAVAASAAAAAAPHVVVASGGTSRFSCTIALAGSMFSVVVEALFPRFHKKSMCVVKLFKELAKLHKPSYFGTCRLQHFDESSECTTRQNK